MEIKPLEVYTTEEAQQRLKISNSTLMRMIKKGLIRTAKVGKQYRIMGKELLRVVSPEIEDQFGKAYNLARRWAHDENGNKIPVSDEKQNAALNDTHSNP